MIESHVIASVPFSVMSSFNGCGEAQYNNPAMMSDMNISVNVLLAVSGAHLRIKWKHGISEYAAAVINEKHAIHKEMTLHFWSAPTIGNRNTTA